MLRIWDHVESTECSASKFEGLGWDGHGLRVFVNAGFFFQRGFGSRGFGSRELGMEKGWRAELINYGCPGVSSISKSPSGMAPAAGIYTDNVQGIGEINSSQGRAAGSCHDRWMGGLRYNHRASISRL